MEWWLITYKGHHRLLYRWTQDIKLAVYTLDCGLDQQTSFLTLIAIYLANKQDMGLEFNEKIKEGR